MRAYIEPFVTRPIVTSQTEHDVTSYYDKAGDLVAVAYFHEGEFYTAEFHGTSVEQTPITNEEVERIVKQVQKVFQQEKLVIDSIVQMDDEFIVSLKMLEPLYKIPIQGSGMNVTISATGFVEEVTLNDDDFTITYPEKLISKEEARAILQQQPLLKLGIASELGWQYAYTQNYDINGIAPDGKVRLWTEDETMQDASFEKLPEVDDIKELEAFLKGGRKAAIEVVQIEDEQRWDIESDEQMHLEENCFLRACKVVKNLVGAQYNNYFVEQYPTLKKLLALEDGTHTTFRFVYIINDISFEFHALSISVNTETNQIQSVTYPTIPFETFQALPLPTITLEEANKTAQQLVDVELTLECDIQDRKKLSFVYLMDYPTSPTGGHIQFVDGFTGEIHWIETGW